MSKQAELSSNSVFVGRVLGGEKLAHIKDDYELAGYSRGTVARAYHQVLEQDTIKVKEAQAEGPSELATAVLGILKRGRVSIEDLADNFDVAPGKIRGAISELGEFRYLAEEVDGHARIGTPQGGSKSTINIAPYYGTTYRFGLCGDNHICSNYERMDVLHAIYDIYARDGIKDVFNTGNWIDGEARFNKQDIYVHGMGNQLRHFAKVYPQRPGVTTQFVAGDDHEGWYVQREGVNIGQLAEDEARRQGRTDLVYLGYMEHDVELVNGEGNSSKLRVVHPGGGSAYALSYTTQKLIESYSGGEKPAIVALGHYHKAEYLHYRNIHAIQTGCTMDQSPFMRKKRLSAHIGGWIVEVNQAPDGSINRCRSEWISFYNKQFYAMNWQYRTEPAAAAVA